MTRLFRAIRDAILLPIGEREPISCREAGRRGAMVRNANAKRPILDRARQLRAECGMDPDPRLGAF